VDRTLAPALALLAACFSPSPPPGAPCAPQERCPSPLTCIDGLCQAPGTAGDGPAADGLAGDGPAGPDGALQCPSGYVKRPSGACHLEVFAPATWVQAEIDCELRGGHLVVPGGLAESSELPNPRWIGVSDRVAEGTFRAVTGAIVSFTNWDLGEPGSLTDCVHTGLQARWHTGPCEFSFPYVCEHDGLPAVPGSYQP
jgi:hypothetical protein